MMAANNSNELSGSNTDGAATGPALSPLAGNPSVSTLSDSRPTGQEVQMRDGALQRGTERAGAAVRDSNGTMLPRSTALAALSEAVKAKAGVKRGPKLGTITNLKREVRRAYLQHAGLIDGEKPINANDLNAKVNCLKLQAALIEGSELAKRVEMLEAQSDRALVEVRTAKEDLT